jgi:hypothetical protein
MIFLNNFGLANFGMPFAFLFAVQSKTAGSLAMRGTFSTLSKVQAAGQAGLLAAVLSKGFLDFVSADERVVEVHRGR